MLVFWCLFSIPLPALAQVQNSEMVFGLRQSFETDDNLDLDPVSEGRTSYASTALSFGLLRSTPIDQFALDVSGVLRAVNGPSVDSGLDEQRFSLAYDREGAQSAFGFNTSYFQSNIEFLRPLEDFENDDGEIDLPSDLDDLTGTGNRENYRSGLSLELGKEAPIGAALSADYSGLRYTDTNDPGLFDNDRSDFDADVFFRFTPRIETSIGADYRLYDAEDDERTRRETKVGYLGLGFEISPIARFDTQIGYTQIDTREFGVTNRTEDPSGFLKFEREMPNGIIDVKFEQVVTEDGNIRNFLIGRSLDLPTGSLAISGGYADSELDSTDFIGSLDWRQQFPRGEFSARASRSLDFDEEKGNILRTALFLGYFHEINAVSGLNFNAGYVVSDEVDDTIDQANASLSYRRAVTAEWSLNTGYRYRMREEIGEPRAQSHSVFFSLDRDFVLKP